MDKNTEEYKEHRREISLRSYYKNKIKRPQYAHEYYLKNEDKIRQNGKKWDELHKEDKREKAKRYRETHKEEAKKYRDAHLLEIREHDRQWRKQYRQNHREQLRFSYKKRRINKKKVGGSHTLGEWELLKVQYDWTCPSCNCKEPLIKLTEDHIIPISKGGSNNIENIQPLCGSCNSKKHTNIILFERKS